MRNDPEAGSSDSLVASRESLVQAHVIHDFRPKTVLENLAGCYGTLIRGVYREMLPLMKGRRIIDCGCGFGQFSRVALDAGFEVTPIDIDDVSLTLARDIFSIPCRKESIYATSLPDGSCDTAVCCDSIQHFDINKFVPELKRLGVQRIVIYDSNISNPMLTAYRLMAGHKESNDRTADAIVREFCEHGYDVSALRYENVIALPISGGFQRPPVPLVHHFPSAIRRVDALISRAARLLRLDRRLTFRFLLVLDRRETSVPRSGSELVRQP
jgi:SAM-dependent methyltransferase